MHYQAPPPLASAPLQTFLEHLYFATGKAAQTTRTFFQTHRFNLTQARRKDQESFSAGNRICRLPRRVQGGLVCSTATSIIF